MLIIFLLILCNEFIHKSIFYCWNTSNTGKILKYFNIYTNTLLVYFTFILHYFMFVRKSKRSLLALKDKIKACTMKVFLAFTV